MPFLLNIFSTYPSISIPQSLVGRLVTGFGWLVMAAVIIGLLRYWRSYNRPTDSRYWGILIALAIVMPFANLFIGVELSTPEALSPQNVPIETAGLPLMVFSALPTVLAAGLLGPAGAALIGAISGLIQALWDSHSPFTILELAVVGMAFGVAMQQCYRTFFYRLLRHPFFAAIIIALFYPFMFIFTASLAVDGSLATRLDYALNLVSPVSLALAIELMVAGVFAEVVKLGLPTYWGAQGGLRPAPSEQSLQARFLQSVVPIILVLFLALLAVNWVMAGTAARQILAGRMGDVAQMASKGIPYFLIVGQNEVNKVAGVDSLLSLSPAELSATLAEYMLRVPFFNQFYVLDASGNSIGGYPNADYDSALAPTDEQVGVRVALQGVEYHAYAISPKSAGRAAQVSFIARITDKEGTLQGVLVARADLDENPFTVPIITSLQSMDEIGGQGLLLDDKGRILSHPNSALVMSEYSGRIPEEAEFFDDRAPDGTRQLVFYQPIEGYPWAVVTTAPAQQVQGIALEIAAPVLVILIILAIVTVLVLRFRLKAITSSLQTLALQSSNMARGQLDEPLTVDGEDEVGQLRRTFEQMRLSLKQRLDELNQLLAVVQGVASNLEVSQAVKPVLDSALSSGASAARVILDPKMVPELEGVHRSPVAYSAGLKGEAYSYLDAQILSLTRQQERLVMNNVMRPRLLRFGATDAHPDSLMAVALRHENQYYGSMWVAYDQAHTFPEEEVRFVVTLAGQAALAAANARLFLNAEIGRQRLSAILASTPEPVLVTDQQNRLLLANPAAWRVLGLGVEWEEGKPINEVISQKDLLALLDSKADDKRAVEVNMPDGRIYYASASSVFAEGHRVGRVCVLRDITSFKELDALKSEFVATVSHDLRSPLTLVRGYASMLEIVGEVNDQQTSYVRKIILGVEDMSRLVNDLLDLGRIEAGVGLQVGKVPVREVAERVTSSLQPQATQKKVHLSTDIPQQTPPFIEADQALLQQALHNLVDNAIKYTDPLGKVQVKAEVRQDMMVFIISDTGSGISPLDQPRIFEKFFRSSAQSGRRPHGTGLGLAIVKSIADRHGGKVWVESQLGKGSVFYLAVPIRRG